MALAATPSNLSISQGNNSVYLSWTIVGSATSYAIKRSTDGVTFSALGTSTAPNYTDSTVSLGTQYWYEVASVNGSDTSPYTSAVTTVPAPNGEMSLLELRLRAKQRADLVNSQFVTDSEWNSYINQSLFELYDLLITVYEDYFFAIPINFAVDGSSQLWPLPNGSNTFKNSAGATITPKALYKLMGVDLKIQSSNQAFVTIPKFNFQDRNQYVYPNTASTIYGVFNLRYRMIGNNIEFIPTPSANQTIQLWYVPKMDQLIADTDLTVEGVSGWLEYVIVDAAIKAMQKEESDVSVLMAQKQALKQRIEESASNRDAGRPDTISDVRRGDLYGDRNWGGGSGPIGGF